MSKKGEHPDNILIEGIRNGSAEDFEELFIRYCQPLINFNLRLVGEVEIAEDITQDVFIYIWKNRSKLKPELSIKSYLFTSVRNRALNHLRHKKIEVGDVANKAREPVNLETPEGNLDQREMRIILDQFIAQLPEKCREIFTMSKIDGLKYAEIAEILGISVKTVEAQMGLALKKLRASLSPYLSLFSP